jgi:hypothetical protein
MTGNWIDYRVVRRCAPRPPAWVVRSTASGIDVAVFPIDKPYLAVRHAAELNDAVRQQQREGVA